MPAETIGGAFYSDLSPLQPKPKVDQPAPVAVRDEGAGLPTKEERREIDRLRGQDQPESPASRGDAALTAFATWSVKAVIRAMPRRSEWIRIHRSISNSGTGDSNLR